MSKRIEILNAVKAKVETVTDFGNRVYKKITMPEMIKEYPVANVIMGDSNYTALTGQMYTTEDSGFFVSVIVWEKVANDIDNLGLLTDALDDLVEKVINAVLDDCSLGLAFVRYIELASIIPVVDWRENYGAQEIIFRVAYDFEKGNF